jgi:hypothetical protein
MTVDPAIALVVRLAYALLFGAAAAHKLRERRAFRTVLAGYEIVPARAIPAAEVAVVAAELAIAIGLVVPAGAASAAAVGIALLGLYAGAIAINLRAGRGRIACGCGGWGGEKPITRALVLRNALLAGGLALALVPTSARGLGGLDAITVGAAVLAAALLYSAADVALANAGRPAWAEAAP